MSEPTPKVHLPVRFRKNKEHRGELRPGWFPLDAGPAQPNQSLVDAMRVLQAVLFSSAPVTAAEVARSLGMELTRAHRLLRTLSMLGMAFQTSRKRFVSGPAMYVFSAQALLNADLAVAAKEPLDALHRETGLEVALGMLWRDYVSYIYHAAPDMPLDAAPGQVSMFPASRSSIGHVLLGDVPEAQVRTIYGDRPIEGYDAGIEVLLAQLGRIREQGYARVERREDTGRVSIAIRLPSRPFTAIGIGGDLADGQTEGLVARLKLTAAAIDQRLDDAEQSRPRV